LGGDSRSDLGAHSRVDSGGDSRSDLGRFAVGLGARFAGRCWGPFSGRPWGRFSVRARARSEVRLGADLRVDLGVDLSVDLRPAWATIRLPARPTSTRPRVRESQPVLEGSRDCRTAPRSTLTGKPPASRPRGAPEGAGKRPQRPPVDDVSDAPDPTARLPRRGARRTLPRRSHGPSSRRSWDPPVSRQSVAHGAVHRTGLRPPPKARPRAARNRPRRRRRSPSN
jgi:hypothetical protein